jgi:hypothetical protein
MAAGLRRCQTESDDAADSVDAVEQDERERLGVCGGDANMADRQREECQREETGIKYERGKVSIARLSVYLGAAQSSVDHGIASAPSSKF